MDSSGKRKTARKQTLQAGNGVDKEENSETNFLISAFEPEKTRKLLKRVEPRIAKISQPWLKLIDTTSSIFLKRIIDETNSSEDRNSSPSNNNESSNIVTLDDVRTTVSSNGSFQFLENATRDVKDKDQRVVKEYTPSVKKRKTDAKSAKLLKENNADDGTMGTTIVAAAAAAASSERSALDSITPDDDDYD